MESSQRKDKKKIISIVIIVLAAIITVTGIFIGNLVRDHKRQQENIEIIRDRYSQLSVNAVEYNQIRTELSEKLNNFIYENYTEEHNSYVEILTKYNTNIQKIEQNVSEMEERCDIIYDDSTVNAVCQSYDKLYEKMVNLYVIDLTNYNDKVTSYNEYKKDNIELFDMIHKDYIDYNNDEKYEGTDAANEENK